MPRLFLGQRESDFFSDITKEIIKDVAGQKIFYYTIREDLSDVHDVYEEALHKIFNPPIEVEYFFEITSFVYDKLVYGQVERIASVKLMAKQARIEHIFKTALGPTSEAYL